MTKVSRSRHREVAVILGLVQVIMSPEQFASFEQWLVASELKIYPVVHDDDIMITYGIVSANEQPTKNEMDSDKTTAALFALIEAYGDKRQEIGNLSGTRYAHFANNRHHEANELLAQIQSALKSEEEATS
jgi:hypothetical protein